MKKYLCKFISILTMMLLLVGMIPCVYAYEKTQNGTLEYQIINGEVEITGYKTNIEGTYDIVDIPEKIDGFPVTSIGNRAFANCFDLKEITIPSTVKRIGDYAFYSCSSLTDFTIPDGVEQIGVWAFYYCNSLMNISFPESLVSIGDWIFSDCARLKSVTFSEGINKISSSAFINCPSLENVTIPESVTIISSGAFMNCSSLKNIVIPKNVNEIGASAFDGCKNLRGVYISCLEQWCNCYFANVNSNPLYYAGNLYLNNELVEHIDIPDSVTSLGNNVFYGLTSLKSISIHKNIKSINLQALIGTSSLSKIDVDENNAFYCSVDGVLFNKAKTKCIKYPDNKVGTSYILPETVIQIEDNAFANCRSLKSIEIPSGVSSIGSKAFSGCSSLESIVLPTSVTQIDYRTFLRCTNLGCVVIPPSVQRIDQSAFEECSDKLNICGYIDSYAHTYADECGIEFVPFLELTDSDSGVKVITKNGVDLVVDIVDDSKKLEEITLSLVDEVIVKVYDISLLQNGEELQPEVFVTVKIPSDVENAVVYSIADDKTLTQVNSHYEQGNIVFTSDALGEYVLAVEDVKYNNLIYSIVEEEVIITGYGGFSKSLTIPDTIEGYPVTTIGDSAFIYSGISEVSLPKTLKTIERYAFYCSGIESVSFPDSLKSIGDAAFSACQSLETVDFNEKLESIGDSAFYDNSSLNKVLIPCNISEIGKNAFKDCGLLFDADKGLISDFVMYGYSKSYAENYAKYNGIEFGSVGVNEGSNVSDELQYSIENCIATITGYSGKESRLWLPEKIEGCVVKYIGSGAFYGCESLEQVILPNSVIGISSEAFNNCINLKEVFIPQSVSAIQSWIFEDCYSLTDIYFGGTEEEWENLDYSGNEFVNRVTIHYEATVVVPKPNNLLGDANGDGKVNVKDATEIQKAVAGLLTFDKTEEFAADVDGSDKVNVKDATAIQKWIAGIETGYLIGEPVKEK